MPTKRIITQAELSASDVRIKMLEVLQKIEMLMTKADRDQLEDWADFGARVYLLAHETREAIAAARI